MLLSQITQGLIENFNQDQRPDFFLLQELFALGFEDQELINNFDNNERPNFLSIQKLTLIAD